MSSLTASPICVSLRPAALHSTTHGGVYLSYLSADTDQFLTIAKFRALRKLWARVEQACGLAPKPAMVAAETAWRMLTQRDPNVNMLRTTVAVAAAGLGGADTIVALPHTLALRPARRLRARVARNTQLVLLEESHLAKVGDPAAGSGAIEAPTNELCAAAWSQFQDIEKAGGAWAALEAGPHPEKRRERARRAADRGRAPQGPVDRHQRLSEPHREIAGGARRRAPPPR